MMQEDTADVVWPEQLPPLKDAVREFLESTHQTCSLIEATSSPHLFSPEALDCIVGNVISGAPGETWPTFEGLPMVGVCQLNLTKAPCVPSELNGIALITIFMAREDGIYGPRLDYPIGDMEKCVIREYASLEDLAPYADAPTPEEQLPGGENLRPTRCEFRPFMDYQYDFWDYEDVRDKYFLSRKYEKIIMKEFEAQTYDDEEKRYGCKLGGWPAPFGAGSDDRRLTIQLGSERMAGLRFGDEGCIYFWKKGEGLIGEWETDFDTH